jgi:hypothetical protein
VAAVNQQSISRQAAADEVVVSRGSRSVPETTLKIWDKYFDLGIAWFSNDANTSRN